MSINGLTKLELEEYYCTIERFGYSDEQELSKDFDEHTTPLVICLLYTSDAADE